MDNLLAHSCVYGMRSAFCFVLLSGLPLPVATTRLCAADLPLKDITLPPGFKIEVFAKDLKGAKPGRWRPRDGNPPENRLKSIVNRYFTG